jgi:geranylgeranyl pyrophosphate synthase
LNNSLFAPVANEIALVERTLRESADVEHPWLSEVLDHIVSGGGKRLRPALTLLGGKFHDYNLDLLVPMASGVELLHTATLVHDDTIDNAAKRRGRPTASKLWGGGIAILAGDYLFARSAEFVACTCNLRVIRLFARTLMELCSGELEQSFSSFNRSQTRESYFDRISKKTASLFATATESAGILSDAPERDIQALKSYGSNLGMAFQVADDILDYTADEERLGKPVASDLVQGTLTLPAIVLGEKYPNDNPIASVFDRRDGERKQQALQRTIEIVNNSDILTECYRIAQGFADRACNAVAEFPDSPPKGALVDIAQHSVVRQK